MTLPRSVSEVLKDHVTLEVEGIDRMYLNVYIPQLQREQGVVNFLRYHRGQPFASSALLAPISEAFIRSIESFIDAQSIPMLTFAKDQRKDDVTAEFLSKFDQEEGVLYVGKAQEKTPVFRTEKRRNPETRQTYPWIVRLHGDGQSLLLLLRGPRLRPVLHQVLFLLPVQRQALPQRP